MERLSSRFLYYSGLLVAMNGSEIIDDLVHIQNLLDLEEQGLLLKLPCKVGTKVFYVQKCLAPSCKNCMGFTRVNNCYTEHKARIFEQEFTLRHLKAFGETVFLTKAEAEKALAEMEE